MAIRKSFLAIAVATAALAGCGTEDRAEQNAAGPATTGNAAGTAPGEATPEATIAQALAGSADHSTLVGALRAAGLEATLAGPGPYTIFAPANGAFEKLPAGTAKNLLKQEQKAQLTSLLTSHVLPGVWPAADPARPAGAATRQATT